jgi:hypothetical protein
LTIFTPSKLTEVLESFIKKFRDRSGNLKYREKISQIVTSGAKSLIIDFEDLLTFDLEIATK